MGKGSRNRNREEKKDMAVAKKKSFPVFTVFCIIVGLLLAFSIAYSVYTSNGGATRNQVVMEIGGEKISGLDFQYAYMSSVNSYWFYMSYLSGVRSLSDVKTKPCAYDKDKTWAEYLGETTISSLQNELLLYVDAKDKGMTLSEESRKKIDEQIASLTKTAKEQHYSLDEYLSIAYVTGYKRADLERMLTIYHIAQQNSTEVIDGMTYTDEQLEAYYNKHRSDMDNFTFNVKAFEFTDKTVDSDGAPIEGAHTKEEAEELAKVLLEKIQNGMSFADAAEDTEGETERKDLAYSSIKDGAKVKEWLADEGRKENDLEIVEGDDAFYVVQFISAVRDDYKLVTIKRVIKNIESKDGMEDEEKQKLLEELKKDLDAKLDAWDKTSDGFTKMAKEINSNLSNDGLVEDVTKNYYSENTDKWLFDEERKEGDYTILENSSKTGYELLYFVSRGEQYWKKYSTNSLKSEDYQAYLEKLRKDRASTIIIRDKDALALVK